MRPDPVSRVMVGAGCLLIVGTPVLAVLYAWLT